MIYVVVGKWLLPPITVTQAGAVLGGYGLQRDYVAWEDMSAEIKLAAIASEDQLFTDHEGFDWKSIEKSMEEKKGKRKKQRGAGASTISQQTAKNVFLWQANGWGKYVRKVPELFYTKMIEWTWGKKRILEVYLNVIEMGPGIFGVEAASRAYFNKSAKNLSRQEAAMIIACLPNPKKFTVKPLSTRVRWRSPQIVQQMGFLEGDDDIRKLLKQ